MADTVHRFLPWARRGLAAALPPETGPPPAVLAARAPVAVTVTVTNAGAAQTSAVLNGPGDVVGLDPQQVVRTYPRAYATNTEPNFLAAVDLDAPELPWLFTPRGIPVDGHLPPWLVLVVVEDREGVSLTLPRGAALPRLRIDSGASVELPDLADSWAWAHVQLVEPSGGAGDIGAALAAQPDRNVSRLVCPRRLAPDRRWIAALVPAFDAGVVRGLGGTPDPTAPLGPAWTAMDTVTLPTYFHWEFQTGPEGDFESLAQRLKPHQAATSVGSVPMHVGEGAPPVRVPRSQVRIVDMDGALRAPVRSDAELADVPAALRDGLQEVTRTLADAADGILDGQALLDDDRQPVGPPIYASSHVRRWQVADGDAEWFRELNLDPRARVAAWLATECVRDNQEDIAGAAWRQVGDVLSAEAALQRAALGALVSTAFHRRHLVAMADDRLLSLAAPAAARTPWRDRSLTAAVAESSLPDAVLDAGLRRALAPAGRAVARAAVRAGVPATQVRTGLVTSLARGREDLDATRFARPALSGVSPAALHGASDLAAIGLPVEVGRPIIDRLTASARALAEALADPRPDRLAVRTDLRRVGLLGQAHVDAARTIAAGAGRAIGEAIGAGAGLDAAASTVVATGAILDAVRDGAVALGGTGVGLVVNGPAFQPGTTTFVDATRPIGIGLLDIDRRGTLVVRTPRGQANVPVARIDPTLTGVELTAVLSRLPANVLTLPVDGAVHRDLAELPLLARGGPAVFPTPAGGVVANRSPVSPVLRRATPGPATPGAPGTPVRAGTPRPEGTALTPIDTRPLIPIGLEPVVVAGPVVAGTVTAAGAAITVTMPPLIRDTVVLAAFETAIALQRTKTALTVDAPVATLVPFGLDAATTSVRAHLDPAVAQPLRRDALVSLAGSVVGSLFERRVVAVDGWWATRAIDRVMAYPTFPVAAYTYLEAYDRTRFCPGIDEVPPDSITLLETNPRFIASFMAGLNHETNRELLWRGFPTDARGTPFRRFWSRLDGKDDIRPIHGWRDGNLARQTTDPKGNLVLLMRGDLLRRYPNTIVVALRAAGAREPSRAPQDLRTPVFAGQFSPDVSFFGFPLVDTDLDDGAGWFFALMEPVTEPRFGLDETVGGPSAGDGGPSSDRLAWSGTGVLPGGHLGQSAFGSIGLNPAAAGADDVAATLLQRPFALYVHARHLLAPLPVQR